MKINLSELLTIAKEHLSDMSTLENPDIRLEQAEYIKKDNVWEVVVSFLVANTNKRVASNKLALIGGMSTEFEFHRIYKRLKIDSEKQIIGMYLFNNKE